jgi:hypothetical protein
MPILSVGEKTKIISCHSFLVIFNVIVTWHEFTTNVLQCYKQGSQQSFLKGSLPLLKKNFIYWNILTNHFIFLYQQ